MNTASRASELDKLYQNIYRNIKNATGSAWEKTLLDNARNVSTPLAIRMLVQMGLGEHTNAPFKLLENACGAGVVAPLLQQIIKPGILRQSSILCGDFSDQAVDLARKRIEAEGWVSTTATKVDAQVRLSSGSVGLDPCLAHRCDRKPALQTAHSLMSQPTSAFTSCPTRRQP